MQFQQAMGFMRGIYEEKWGAILGGHAQETIQLMLLSKETTWLFECGFSLQALFYSWERRLGDEKSIASHVW
ncbi:unnamed protein product [Prunus armeniaca]